MEQFLQHLDTIARPYPLQYAISLYNEVLKYKPKVCYEVGSSWGFTTCAIAKALQDINEGGKLYSCDIDVIFYTLIFIIMVTEYNLLSIKQIILNLYILKEVVILEIRFV